MTDTHDLRERIDHFASLEGEGTELVSLTVPPDTSLRAVRERVAEERAGAENIRSDRTRKRVQRALDRIQRELRAYEETPETGLAVYAGVVDDELVSAVFDDLPAPVPASTYRCDDRFHVDPLEAAAAPAETYGLVVVERGAAAVGRLAGERVVPVRTLDSRVMGSSRAGGQSARRFERQRQRQRHEFFLEVAETTADAFLGSDPVAGLAVGGTLTSVEAFVDGEYLDHRLRDRLVGTYAVEYAGVQGLRQLVDAAEDALLDADRRATRDRLEEFFVRLRDDDPVVYGRRAVERAAEFGAVDVALVSATRSADEREAVESAVDAQGGETYVVTGDTDAGARFAETFGVGALLRFPVN